MILNKYKIYYYVKNKFLVIFLKKQIYISNITISIILINNKLKFALLGLYYNIVNSNYKYKILNIYTMSITNLSKYNTHNNISLLILYKYKIQYTDINKLTTPAKAIHLARTFNINSFKL